MSQVSKAKKRRAKKKDEARTHHDNFPFSLVFNPSGLFMEDPYYCTCTVDEKNRFKQLFKVVPKHFIRLERNLKQRCNEHGTEYIPPKLHDTVERIFTRRAELNKAINKMQKRVIRANETVEQKNTHRVAGRDAKRRARAKESPEKKAARNEANKIRMRKARALETPQQKYARNKANQMRMRRSRGGDSVFERRLNREKRRLAWIKKKMSETNEEAKKRRMSNLESQRRRQNHRQRVPGVPKHVTDSGAFFEREETVYLNRELFKAVGIDMYKDIKTRACIYKCRGPIPDSEVLWNSDERSQRFKIGQHLYIENGDDMGIKGWTSCQSWSPCPYTDEDARTKLAVCDAQDFRSNFEIDNQLLKKLNFTAREFDNILDSSKPTMTDLTTRHPWDPAGWRWNGDPDMPNVKVSMVVECYKMGVNNDGSDILVVAPMDCATDIQFLDCVFFGEIGSEDRKECRMGRTPDEVTLLSGSIMEIIDGHVKSDLFYSSREGSLKIGHAGTSLDMIQGRDQGYVQEAISRLEPYDWAFVKRSNGRWTLAVVVKFRKERWILFNLDGGGHAKKVYRKNWVSCIRLVNTRSNRQMLNELEGDSDNETFHMRDYSESESDQSIDSERSDEDNESSDESNIGREYSESESDQSIGSERSDDDNDSSDESNSRREYAESESENFIFFVTQKFQISYSFFI